MSKNRSKRQKGKLVYQQNGEAVISLNHAAGINDAEKAKGPVVTIKFKHLAIVAYLYMVVPILIFFVSWLRWYVGFPMAAVLAFGLYKIIKNDYLDGDEINIPLKSLFIAAIAIGLWLWFSGIAGDFVTSYDYPWRTATYRDLITFQWPIVYPKTNNALVYYLMFWIVPAAITKAIGIQFAGSVLFIWSLLGLIVVFLLTAYNTNGFSPTKLCIVCVLFLCWSGLNTVGSAITDILNISYNFALVSSQGWLDHMHNGYPFDYFYRSNNESLIEIYNQAIVTWMAVNLVLTDKKVEKFAFIGLVLFTYAPLSLIGLLPILLLFFAEELKRSKAKVTFKKIISIPNLCAIFTVFPIAFLYFKSNINGTKFSMYVPWSAYDLWRILALLLFYALEFGIIAVIIYPKYKKSLLFIMVTLCLIVIPLFKEGLFRDFCMNASLPALFLLMMFTIRYINEEIIHKFYSGRGILLIIVLTLAAISPIQDIAGKLNTIGNEHKFPIINDSIYTWSDKKLGDPNTAWMMAENYLVPNPETKAFYKYLARTDPKE